MTPDASFVHNSLAWGNLEYDFWIKSGENFNFYEHSVAYAGQATPPPPPVRHASGAAQGPDSIILSEEQDLDLDREFADADNHDFRLQARSRFRRAAPDGTDRGAFAYEENIRYLAPPAATTPTDYLSTRRSGRSARRSPGCQRVTRCT